MSTPEAKTDLATKVDQIVITERRRLFWRMFKVQGLMLLAVITATGIWQNDEQILMASLVGGAISMLGTTWAGYRTLMTSAAQTPEQLVAAFYRGEVGKIALTLLLFGLVFHYWEALRNGKPAIVMLASFLVIQVASWWFGKSRPTEAELAYYAEHAKQDEPQDTD